jgi:hypothetical protein
MVRGKCGPARGERQQQQAYGGKPYRDSLLTRNETRTSNRAYEYVSFNFF